LSHDVGSSRRVDVKPRLRCDLRYIRGKMGFRGAKYRTLWPFVRRCAITFQKAIFKSNISFDDYSSTV